MNEDEVYYVVRTEALRDDYGEDEDHYGNFWTRNLHGQNVDNLVKELGTRVLEIP